MAQHGTEISPEKLEEEKLRARYPHAKCGAQFLQKRLQQRKFFDSGDYNVAKSKGIKTQMLPSKPTPGNKPGLSAILGGEGLGTIGEGHAAPDDSGDDDSSSPTGNQIPTPATVPQRKASLVPPTASKLSPQPIHHHIDANPLADLEM